MKFTRRTSLKFVADNGNRHFLDSQQAQYEKNHLINKPIKLQSNWYGNLRNSVIDFIFLKEFLPVTGTA